MPPPVEIGLVDLGWIMTGFLRSVANPKVAMGDCIAGSARQVPHAISAERCYFADQIWVADFPWRRVETLYLVRSRALRGDSRN